MGEIAEKKRPDSTISDATIPNVVSTAISEAISSTIIVTRSTFVRALNPTLTRVNAKAPQAKATTSVNATPIIPYLAFATLKAGTSASEAGLKPASISPRAAAISNTFARRRRHSSPAIIR